MFQKSAPYFIKTCLSICVSTYFADPLQSPSSAFDFANLDVKASRQKSPCPFLSLQQVHPQLTRQHHEDLPEVTFQLGHWRQLTP